MCGRFALFSDPPRITRRLGLPEAKTQWQARYNIPPGTWIPAARRRDNDSPLLLDQVWWGYKPQWAKENAPEPINATVEKVATSSYFKGAFSHHRCLVPADGWFEWVAVDGHKQPHFLCREDREPIWLAAIWAERADGAPGCAILTEPARGVAQQIHPRMPLVLDDESLEPWLDSDMTERETLRQIIHHLSAEHITHWPVSSRVNKPAENDPKLIEPVTSGSD
ncbi:SOS response-associated peptidase [Halomonas sp. LR5S13]|uniref:SOS response-associated peptidase n=1 Tax=Halomonas rhizosphaerae TaxID=3043296 RepID=UPI0024A9B8A7|nr:SOS response-associated peptidase [Halomonas rhizosphaerae]MDI5922492.1 SOS response-associated peptidase [Halomonas rhizosphaerae]